MLVLGEAAYGWPPELLTIVRIINHGEYSAEELRRSQNQFAAWLCADLVRRAAGRKDSYNEHVQKTAAKLAAFEAIAAGYEPDLERLLTDVAKLLTHDLELANTVKNNMSGNC